MGALWTILFQARNVQHAAYVIRLGQGKRAGFGDTQPLAKHQKQKATVAGLIPAAFGGRNELIDLGRNEMFSVGHR